MPEGDGGAGKGSDNSNNGGNQNGNGNGGGDGSNGSGNQNNQNQNQTPFAGLSQENQTWVQNKGFKALDDAFKSHRELESKLSSGAHKNQSQHRLGDYAFAKPANAKDIGYEDAFAENFKVGAHKLGVDPQVASGIHDWFVEYAAGAITKGRNAQAEALNNAVTSAEKDLVKAFGGDPNTPQFKRSHELALRAMRLLKVDGEKLGVLAKHSDKLKVADAAHFAAFAQIGQSLYAEDHLHGERADNVNPFDPKSQDIRAQSDIIKNDPDKAEQLIRSLTNKADQAMWAMFLQKQEQKRR